MVVSGDAGGSHSSGEYSLHTVLSTKFCAKRFIQMVSCNHSRRWRWSFLCFYIPAFIWGGVHVHKADAFMLTFILFAWLLLAFLQFL